MCGVIGFSGKNHYNIDKIKLLYTYNTLTRGNDSIGLFSPINGVYKKAGKPVDLLPKMDIKPDNYFIGHVRSGTVGVNNDANAHPFIHHNLLGVMNGTTSNHWALADREGFKRQDFNVDSDIIFAIIQKQASFKVLGEIIGGCAILVYDANNPNILYVFRNDQGGTNSRPLFRGTINGDMYISSIEESLKIIGCDKVQEFKANYVYTIVNGNIKSSYKIKNQPFNPGPDLSGKVPIISSHLKNSNFIGRWMFFDNPYHYSNQNAIKGNLTEHKWYYCVGYESNNEYIIYVKGNDGEPVKVSYYAFTYANSFPKTGDVMIVLENLTHGKKETKLFDKGDICILVEYGNKYIKVKRNVNDDKTWLLDYTHARPVNWREEKEYKEKIDEITTIDITNVSSTTKEEKKTISQLPMAPLGGLFPNMENFDNKIETGSDIVTGNKALPPWPEETLEEQLDNARTDVEDIDDDHLYIPTKDFRRFIENLEYSINGIKEYANTMTAAMFVRNDVKAHMSELEAYIDRSVENFLGNH